MIRAAFKFSIENVIMQYCSNIHYLLNMCTQNSVIVTNIQCSIWNRDVISNHCTNGS